MKRFVLFCMAASATVLCNAQSVAINLDGTPVTDPSALLEIKKGQKSKVRIRSLNHNDTSQLEFSNQFGSLYTHILISQNREEGLLFSSSSDVPDRIQDNIFSMRFSGPKTMFGMNIKVPQSLLHVHDPGAGSTTLRVTNSFTGTSYLRGLALSATSFDASVVNAENGNLFFGTNNLLRGGFNTAGNFGIGILAASERLEVTGNVKLNASDKGIWLNAADRPFITRGFDPFTSGIYNGLGRWGLFMEPSNLTVGIPDVPGKRFQVAKYNTNSTNETLLAVDVNGKVTRPATGGVNLLPICMGYISPGGGIVSGTGNFTVLKDIASGLTEITINGETYNSTDYIVQATCVKTTAEKNFAMTEDPGNGKLRIWTYNDGGTVSNRGFHFVLYKLN